MVLVKEIERALKPENYEVTAQEDEILAGMYIHFLFYVNIKWVG